MILPGRTARSLSDSLPSALAASWGCVVMAWLGLYGWAWTDYDVEARPAFDALVNGHLARFLDLAPSYGGSLILRAPFVLMTRLWGGGELSIFRAAAAPCLAATAIFGVWLMARMRARGQSFLSRAIALFLCVANPVTLHGLEVGHPEELLGAVLCVGAVICAVRERTAWAGVLLGLAIANKEWAIVAGGPVLLALPRHRLRAAATAAGIAMLVMAPLALAGSTGFLSQAKGSALRASVIFQPWQLWWFLGSHGHVVRGTFGNLKIGYRTPPVWVEGLAHPLIVAITVPVTLLYAWARSRGSHRGDPDPLLLLALLLLLRCVLDPWDTSYYCLPFLFALLTWEALRLERPPVLALFGSFSAWFAYQATASTGLRLSADTQSLIFALFAVPALTALVTALFAPGLARRLLVRPRRGAVAVAA